MTNVVDYILNMRGNLQKELEGATHQSKGLDGALSKAKGMAGQLAGAFGVAFGVAGVAMFAQKVVQAGTTVEDATTGLTTLLKDAGEAAQVVNNTMDDATKTPFSFSGLLAGNQALISAGESADKARETVLNLGNAVSGAGKGNYEFERMIFNLQQIKTTGNATAMDIRQFGIAGINIYELLHRSTGKSVAEVKKMNISYEMLQKALKDAAGAGGVYENAMANMANNTSVKISNVGDAFFKSFNNIFEKLKPSINDFLDGTIKMVEKLGSKIVKLIEWFQKYSDVIQICTPIIGLFVLAIGSAAVYVNSAAIGTWLYSAALSTLNVVTAIATGATWLFSAALWSTGIPEVVIAITALIVGVIALTKHFGGFGNMVKAIWEMIKDFVKGVVGVFMGIKDATIDAFTFDNEQTKRGLDGIVKAVKNAKKGIVEEWNNPDAQKAAKEAEKTTKKIIPDKKTTNTTDLTKNPPAPALPKTKAEGQKNINITVTYNAPLIKDFTISTTNITEGLDSLKEKIAAILTGATHDALMVADY